MASRKKGRGGKKKSAATIAPPPAPSSVNRVGVAVAVLLLVGLTVAVALVGRNTPPATTSVAAPQSEVEASDVEMWESAALQDVPVSPADFSAGPADAPVVIVEFSDFQCPYCRVASKSLEEAMEPYGERVRLVFKNYPLDTACNEHIMRQVHPLACRAAALARCAGVEGRFWEMHDALFELPELTEESLAALPGALGLEPGALSTCAADEETMSRIRADVDEGKRLGVTGTPTIYLNGRVTASYGTENLRSVIEHVLSTN